MSSGVPEATDGSPASGRGTRRAVPVVLVVLLVVGLVLAAGGAAYYWFDYRASTVPGPGTPPFPAAGIDKIQHIFIIDQENRAFDHYFGTYCPAAGPDCSNASIGTPSNVCEDYNLSAPSAGCVSPFPYPAGMTMTDDIGHAWSNAHEAWNGGQMNGFVSAIQGNPLAMGYYTGATLGGYWDLAEQYGLGDDFFSGALSYSLPNHWLIVAGSAPNASYYGSNFTNPNGTIDPTGVSYLNEANQTPTIIDQLVNTSVSWKYYDFPVPANTYNQAIGNGTTWKYWNVLVAKASTYSPAVASHFVTHQQLFTDVANGQAPNVSWVIPVATESEHPPYDVLAGQNWTLSVVDAIENSSIWNTSVIFITWDEYGGFYDNVPPPQVDGYGLGFRVPLIVVGPYVRENFINPDNSSFGSILKFVESRYGLHAVGARDMNAPNLLAYFDFNMTARAPISIPPEGAVYPTSLQTLGRLGSPVVSTTPLGSDSLRVTWSDGGGAAPTGYRVSVADGSGATVASIGVGQERHSVDLTQLPPGTWVVRVTALGPVGTPAVTSLVVVGALLPLGLDFGNTPYAVSSLLVARAPVRR